MEDWKKEGKTKGKMRSLLRPTLIRKTSLKRGGEGPRSWKRRPMPVERRAGEKKKGVGGVIQFD